MHGVKRSGLSILVLSGLLALGGCGGSGDQNDSAPAGAAASSPDQDGNGLLTAEGDNIDAGNGMAAAVADVEPSYRLAAALPPTPGDQDADGSDASAYQPPATIYVPKSLADTDTRGMNPEQLKSKLENRSKAALAEKATTALTFLTPAQVRTAYGLDKLPAASTANKSAYQGSGQIIAIVDVGSYPNLIGDLNTFSTKYGLPTCTEIKTATTNLTTANAVAKPALGSGCTFQAINSTTAGGITTTVPAVNKGWTPEIALDVQWAHAVAPAAKIVLISVPTASNADILGGMALAQKIGANVVSLSLGRREVSVDPGFESYFKYSGMTFVAASGDWGTGAYWPASSPSVLSVGGTQLTGLSPRAETGWSGSGGGLSAYQPRSAWQKLITIPGSTGVAATALKRAIPDVAYNASGSSTVLVYMAPSSVTGGVGWVGMAGTSAGAPQWSGMVAITNSVRALNNKAVLANYSQSLYTNVGAKAGTLASAMLDIKTGTNGSCATCKSAAGFDLVTGMGTPNAVSLINTMSAL